MVVCDNGDGMACRHTDSVLAIRSGYGDQHVARADRGMDDSLGGRRGRVQRLRCLLHHVHGLTRCFPDVCIFQTSTGFDGVARTSYPAQWCSHNSEVRCRPRLDFGSLRVEEKDSALTGIDFFLIRSASSHVHSLAAHTESGLVMLR